MANWTKITKKTDGGGNDGFWGSDGFWTAGFWQDVTTSSWTKITKNDDTWTKITKET